MKKLETIKDTLNAFFVPGSFIRALQEDFKSKDDGIGFKTLAYSMMGVFEAERIFIYAYLVNEFYKNLR